ncbi:NAD-dependent epimerase/dehydratase family protein (plasmid) [Chromobacterium amazonense]|uniref:NAD-dependent epimerase/dehydratase family protein n=1 Tax=Chromobacterium amazonense TaxID=1382803 RepID=UPI00237D6C60|nr:NAD-dependent epimerase/dehydratase family protein [Chromobacterium amazonense]MDE1712172.1 NAD-dependent epimerase/dehydratase family protein [Chromobacterium amazonense]
MSRICLIGGSGFIGLHIATVLVQQGHRLTVATRKAALPAFSVLPSVELASACSACRSAPTITRKSTAATIRCACWTTLLRKNSR